MKMQLLTILVMIGLCLGAELLGKSQNDNFDSNFRWGTYKPQLLHAVTQRNVMTNNPITMALMYYNPDRLYEITDIHYKVPERKSDDIKYTVVQHNGFNLNIQKIHDPLVGVDIKNEWVKLPLLAKINWIHQTSTLKNEVHGINGEVLYIIYYNIPQIIDIQIGIVYAFSIEQFSQDVVERREFSISDANNQVLIQTKSEDGESDESFLITARTSDGQIVVATEILELFQDYDKNWDARVPIFDELIGNQSFKKDRVNVVGVVFRVARDAQITIQVQQSDSMVPNAAFDRFDKVVEIYSKQNDVRFHNIYLKNANVTVEDGECGQASWANLMSGLQYSYGNLDCVQQSENCDQFKGILSHTPSRFGFPRPFLWDEGFHNLVSCPSNALICLQSLSDWVNTMSEDGWIPREQPRGEELRSYIPGLREDKRESNPPTFFFDFEYLLREETLGRQNPNARAKIVDVINRLYPKLKLWYQSWFQTQAVFVGDEFSGLLKWWGGSEDYNLGSGMDDWPRSNGDEVSRYNVDAQSWGYFFCQRMLELTQRYDAANEEFIDELQSRLRLIKLKLDSTLHDSVDGLYKDVLYNKYDMKEVFSPHRGYPNLMPIALGIVDPSNHEVLDAYVKFIMDEQTVWTQYGIRSLEESDQFFGVDSNYWRGPIWINVHYMLLRGIKTFYWDNQNMKTLYTQLRNNIINTVCTQYRETGYFYEHFNQQLDGKGHGNHPFSISNGLLYYYICRWLDQSYNTHHRRKVLNNIIQYNIILYVLSFQ